MKNTFRPFFAEITSGENGNQCDLYPKDSVFEVTKTNDPTKLLVTCGRGGPYLPNFPFKEHKTKPETKQCPYCRTDYVLKAPFITTGQVGEGEPMCITCYEKRYTINHRNPASYREALRVQIKHEYGLI